MAELDRQTPISSTGFLPVSPSLQPTLAAAHVPRTSAVLGPRVVFISALAIGVAFVAGIVDRVLVALIALVTNAAFLGRLWFQPAAPADHHLGLWVLLVPVAGGVIVGVMARFGSKAIRGHGIPEAAHAQWLSENDPKEPSLKIAFLRIIRV